MCTVTYIPSRDSFFITSNRDEKKTRSKAVAPCIYEVNGKKIIYPKDADAGGTWIAFNENGNVIVLLNGAFHKHLPAPPYRESRGLILLKLIAEDKPVAFFNQSDLSNIEPFTLIIIDHTDVFECRWDGHSKHCVQLKKHRPYIWSSATLYNSDVVRKREKWFAEFLGATPTPTQKDILDFHRFTGDGDRNNDLLMEREGVYGTVSITSIYLTDVRASMKYLDLVTGEESDKKIELTRSLQLS